MSKTCPRCKQAPPDTGYYRDCTTADGLQAYCVLCQSLYAKFVRTENPEKCRAYRRQKWQRQKAVFASDLDAYNRWLVSNRERQRSWAARNPDKAKEKWQKKKAKLSKEDK